MMYNTEDIMSRLVRGQSVFASPRFGVCEFRSEENLVNVLQPYGTLRNYPKKRLQIDAALPGLT